MNRSPTCWPRFSSRLRTNGKAPPRPPPAVGPSLPKGYVAYRAAQPITIDGKLDEKAWKAAPWTDTFVDIEGDRKPRPRFDPGQDALGR